MIVYTRPTMCKRPELQPTYGYTQTGYIVFSSNLRCLFEYDEAFDTVHLDDDVQGAGKC